jgi:sterol desaturase/sphingolipid hydroxylase (fatty acid hydroxylase superfamily)
MTNILLFLVWTLLLYWIHRGMHAVSWMRNIHTDHHVQVTREYQGWHWTNLVLYIDTPKSTVDQWISEIIPTLLFSAATGAWWISIFYYLWAAFVQEEIEHNVRFDWYPFLTSGKWHMVHHKNARKNFGVFVPIWDMFFRTYKKHD